MNIRAITSVRVLVALNIGLALGSLIWAANNLWPDRELMPDTDREVFHASPIQRVSVETASVEAHPLFAQNRLPAPMHAVSDASEQGTLQPPPLLVGVFMESQGSVGALLEDTPSGTRKFVRKGEVFLGWALVSLRQKTVVLRHGTQEFDVPLSFSSRSSPKSGASDSTARTP
jgi:hypothetical protein